MGQFTSSPTGAVAKSNGKLRTIHHLSWPRTASRPSVNDGIDPVNVTLSYTTLEPLFNSIRASHAATIPTCLWKADLADAFRHCVVSTHDVGLLRFTFESQRFVDTRLPFGCRSSPFLFNLYAEAFYWILESNGIPLSHYLDGFFGCSANPLEALAAFNSLASHLGISVQARKLESGTKLEILGILIDSANGMASIAPERRVKLLALLNNTLSRDTASALELLAIAGHLVSVCRICPPGRAFLRRIYDASHDLHIPSRRRIPHSAKLDLRWWRDVLRDWDGIRLILPDRPRVELWTDASTTVGFGGHLGPQDRPTAAWCTVIPARLKNRDIMTLLRCLNP